MPSLKPDGTVNYASIQEFLSDYEANISKNGLYLDSQTDWPRQKLQDFRIVIAGTDLEATVRCRAVFFGRGKVGLQIESNTQNKESIAGLLAAARSWSGAVRAAVQPAAEAPVEPPPTVAPPPEEQAAGEFQFRGRISASGGAEEFLSARPVALGSEACGYISLFRLVSSITASGMPVALTLACRGKQLCFRFNDRGNLVQFLGPEVGRDLVERLVQKHMLTRARAQEVLGEIGPTRFAEAVLLEKKYVGLPDIWKTVRDQVVDACEDIRACGDAPYQLDAVNTGRRSGVSFGSLVIPWMERALEALGSERINALLQPLWDQYLALSKKPRWPLDSFDLDSKGERFVREYLDGLRTLSDTLQVFPIRDREKASRLSLILLALGVVEAGDHPVGEEGVSPQALLDAEMKDLGKRSLFHQAGVHWSTHVNEYPGALARLERKYSPGGKLARASAECGRSCQKRLEMARKAVEALQDESCRRQQRQVFVGEYQMKNSADLLYRQALLLLMKNDVSKARELLEVAIELEPLPEYVKKLKSI